METLFKKVEIQYHSDAHNILLCKNMNMSEINDTTTIDNLDTNIYINGSTSNLSYKNQINDDWTFDIPNPNAVIIDHDVNITEIDDIGEPYSNLP